MKTHQLAWIAGALLFASACGSSTSNSGDGNDGSEDCETDSTFALIQQQIFENRNCTNEACHGSQAAGGLDLREGNSYDNLINVQANSGDYVLVDPGEQDASLLYQKVANVEYSRF